MTPLVRVPASSTLPSLATLCLWIAVCGTVWPAAAQTDTTRSAPPPRPSFLETHSPKGALWRAAALPGWGQVYNRQYYKVPVVYLALGGMIALAVNLNRDYRFYRCAFQFKAFQELVDRGSLDQNPRAACEEEYRTLETRVGRSVSSNVLEAQRDRLRRNRDLSFVGIGLVYGLSVLDAFVSAHLLDFDVGEDLTVSLQPHPEVPLHRLPLRFHERRPRHRRDG